MAVVTFAELTAEPFCQYHLKRMMPQIDPEAVKRMMPQIDPEAVKRMMPQIDPEAVKRMMPQIDPLLFAQDVPLYISDRFGLAPPREVPNCSSPHSDRGPRSDTEVRSSEAADEFIPYLGDVGALPVLLSLMFVLSSLAVTDRVAASTLLVVEQLVFLFGLLGAVAAREPAVGGASLALAGLSVALWLCRLGDRQ